MASILGLSLQSTKSLRWRWAVHTWRERMRRAGVFDRLAADELFSPLVNWSDVAEGNYAHRNPFRRGEPLRRVMAAYASVVRDEQSERRAELAQAAGSAGDGLAVRDFSAGELRNLTPAAKRLMRRRARTGCRGGEDALAAVGEDRYAEHLDAITRSVEEECVALARRDRDPALRLDAWLIENELRRAKLIAVPPDWLHGETWKVMGLPAAVSKDSLDLDREVFELSGLDRVPVDVGSVRLTRVAPRLSSAPPF